MFPFHYNGKEYYSCTWAGALKPWCATTSWVNDNSSERGWCQDGCPKEGMYYVYGHLAAFEHLCAQVLCPFPRKSLDLHAFSNQNVLVWCRLIKMILVHIFSRTTLAHSFPDPGGHHSHPPCIESP